jgi:hypothetical protein
MKKGQQLPPAILWLERKLFLNNSVFRDPKIDLWASLKKLLPLYQELGTADRISAVLSEDWYESDLFPREVREALDVWANRHGYSDGWFKNVGAIQLYFWTLDQESLQSDLIHVPSIAHSGLDDGVPPPASFTFKLLEWRPYTGEPWHQFTKRAHKEFEVHLREYRSACMELCPVLAHLHGYSHYRELAQFQAGLLRRNLEDAARKRITRTAKRLRLTLRAERTQTACARMSSQEESSS